MGRHFHPYHLRDTLAAHGHTMSLTTVYRTLSLLVQAGIVRTVTPPDATDTQGVWYEHTWRREHHDHLVCVRCGRVVEFTYPAIEVLQEAVAREHGFTLEGHRLELAGLCPECRASGGKEAGPL